MQTITNSPTTEATPPTPQPDPLPPLNIHPRWRFARISWFFLRVVLHVFIVDIQLGRFRLTRWYVRRTALQRWRIIARRFRDLAVQMGGVQIKLGQFLSARADILPAAITDELAGLQDEVPAAPLPYILARIMEELHAPPEQLFACFDPTPVAAASLGQVYFGTLHDGREVAIKVQRPRIDELVKVDLSAVRWVVRLIKNYPLIRRRAHLEELFDEFARVLLLELDYEQEARNGETFRANFADVPGIAFPMPYPALSTRRVLVMERITGIKINHFAALEAAGVDRAELAERFNGAYLKQIFLDGFFHADPHPGNLFVRVEGLPPAQTNGAKPGAPYTLIFVDTGMVGRLPSNLMANLREGIIGLAANNAEQMVDAIDHMGMILPGADRRPIVRALQIVMRYTYNRTVTELTAVDTQAIFDEVEHLIRDMPFQIPQDLIYLGRAVSLVGGMCTALDPNFNLFAAAQPFAQRMIVQQQGNDWGERLRREVTTLGQIAATLPRQMDEYYKAANRGDLEVRVDLGRLERSMRRVERATSRLAGGVVAGSLFIGGVLLQINSFAAEARWAWVAAALMALWMLWPRGDR
ncbi:MAG TPA: AarF/ABC1/UbiB kinase family protein [Roseiflexaceae bacterium]|nr:AarF/ABC1/UbiB kinase family protein [Roseiflexaceae bacterium]